MFGNIMNYLNPFASNKETKADQEWFLDYEGIVSQHLIDTSTNKKTERCNQGTLTFKVLSENYEYSMEIVPQAEVLKSKEHQTGKVTVFEFPINLDMNLQVNFSSGKASYWFSINNPNYRACVEFDIYEYSDDDDDQNQSLFDEANEFDQSQNFLYIISRLIHQTDKKQKYKEITDKKLFNSYWSFVKEKNPITKDAENLFDILSKGKTVEFCSIGELSVFPNNVIMDGKTKIVILKECCILIIKKAGDNTYDFEIIGDDGKKVYCQKADCILQYNLSKEKKDFLWISDELNTITSSSRQYSTSITPNIAFCFKCQKTSTDPEKLENVLDKVTNYKEINDSADLETQFSENKEQNEQTDLKATKVKQGPEDVDFNDLQMTKKKQSSEDSSQQQSDSSVDAEIYYIEYKQDLDAKKHGFRSYNTFSEIKCSGKNEDLSNFCQAKSIDRTFVSKGPCIEVYKSSLETDELDHILTLPDIQQNEQLISPNEMFLQEQDSKIVMTYNDTAYYYDINKGKIENDFSIEEQKVIDICPYEKTSCFDIKKEFYAITNNGVYLIDPRVGNADDSIVQSTCYSSDLDFCKIACSNENNVTVASNNGEIRLYQNIGDLHAKNVLRPIHKNDILKSVESSKDGTFIQATYDTYILLYPTNMYGKDAFNWTYKKSRKPKARKLEVDIKTSIKNGLTNLSFSKAKFDDKKNQKETMIIACSGKYLFMWSLSDVLCGDLVTKQVKKMTERIISNEFKYDTNKVLALMKRGMEIQDVTCADK